MLNEQSRLYLAKRMVSCRNAKGKLVLYVVFCGLMLTYAFWNLHLKRNEQYDAGDSDDNDVTDEEDGIIQRKYPGQMTRYCNFAILNVNQPTEELPEKYELHAVATVMRHGDRAPLNLKNSYFMNSETKLCRTTNPELISSTNLLEKLLKEYLPEKLKGFTWHPQVDSCSEAQLTKVGAEQMFALGKTFSSKYKGLLEYVLKTGAGRISDDFRARLMRGGGGFIYLRSTDYARTFQSGMSFLAGLLFDALVNVTANFSEVVEPGKDAGTDVKLKKLKTFFKEIVEISSTSSIYQCTQDAYTGGGMVQPSCDCWKVGSMNSLLEQPQTLNFTETKIREVGNKVVSKFFGEDFSVAGGMEIIASYLCHSAKLPCFDSLHDGDKVKDGKKKGSSCLKWSDIGSIVEAVKVVEDVDARNPDRLLTNRLLGYPLLWELWYKLHLSTLYEKMEDNKKARLLIYPSHDSTILPLLDLLGLERNLWWPSFASTLTIEVHSLYQKQHYIKVFYDRTDVTESLIFCRGRYTNSKGMCLFENFTFYVLKDVSHFFDSKKYEEYCD